LKIKFYVPKRDTQETSSFGNDSYALRLAYALKAIDNYNGF